MSQPNATRAGDGLDASLLDLDVVAMARELVGWTVSHGDAVGVIVETEAYHQSEPACHAYTGPTPRTQTLFAEPGLAYVYRSYGIHAMLNVVAEREGVGAAVLIRALEPVAGLEAMARRRGTEAVGELCSGPGKLTQALGIWMDLNGTDLRLGGPIGLAQPPKATPRARVTASAPRVGINRAQDLAWRFCAHESRFVSRPRPWRTRVALRQPG